MAEKQYWKGLAELENSSAHQATVADEFRDSSLPLADVGTSLLEATTPRRDFLKYLGFSTAAATLAAACEMPVRKAIPYAIKPENITPGVANYYASTFVDGGEAIPVVVKTRDGRPIKVEGNEMSPVTLGATSARVQASVLNLYDKTRLRHPMAKGKEATFATIDQQIVAGLGRGTAVLLTSTITSPTVLQVIQNFTSRTGARHIQWDPVSYSALLAANQATYGRRVIPSYRFDRAATIFSLGADFLGTWLSPVAFAKQYGMGRKVSAARPQMSRHYQVESLHTISGAAADRRATCRPSEMGAVALALYNAIANNQAPTFKNTTLNKLLVQAADDLRAGNGLVVCGSNSVAVQTVVNAINNAIGANGRTIDWSSTDNCKQGNDADMQTLLASMEAGQIGTLMMHGVNPVYEHPLGAKFAQAMAKVPTTVSFADRMDETAQKCAFVIPDHNWLESWGDAEPRTGQFSLVQPAIAPLFKTRSLGDSLMTFAGITGQTYGDFWRQYWEGKLGGKSGLDKALQDGVITPAGSGVTMVIQRDDTNERDTVEMTMNAPTAPGMPTASMSLGNATYNASALGAAQGEIGAKQPGKDPEVVVYESVAIGHGGCWSNNPWLQEMPDPITKATWDNYACISPARAKAMDAELTGINEVDPKKKILKISYNGAELKLPIVVVPGMNNDTVGIALGYGRHEGVGRAAANTGQNAYPLRVWNGAAYDCANTTAKVERVDGTYPVAITQTHHSYEGRPIIRELTLASFQKDPAQIFKAREEEIGHYAKKPWEEHGEGAHGGEGHGADAHGGEHGGDGRSAPAAAEHRTDGGEGTNTAAAGHDNPLGIGLGAMAAAPDAHKNAITPGLPSASQLEEGFRENGTLYPTYTSPGPHWGMSVDLNSCIGCGACVIGCQAENNISVVGKEHVQLAHEMHWMRIDRYFSGSVDDPDTVQTVFQPMLCQHCDNAPCENVCPVSATNHSSEGLNQMAYNRCIGTKYCANNCPYKVRHFNWMDWNGADCFDDNLYEDGRRDDVNDDLTRMVLNPDVTVRSRGVMEKCTFCVQRLQEAKLTAKKEGRPVKDGEARTACQQACPTDAILFGNANDKDSAIFKLRSQEQKERMYYVLEQIHTLPNINYLAKVRNTDEVIAASVKDTITAQHI